MGDWHLAEARILALSRFFLSTSDYWEQAWSLLSRGLLPLCDLKLATSQDLKRPACSGTLHPSPPVPWDTKEPVASAYSQCFTHTLVHNMGA